MGLTQSLRQRHGWTIRAIVGGRSSVESLRANPWSKRVQRLIRPLSASVTNTIRRWPSPLPSGSLGEAAKVRPSRTVIETHPKTLLTGRRYPLVATDEAIIDTPRVRCDTPSTEPVTSRG